MFRRTFLKSIIAFAIAPKLPFKEETSVLIGSPKLLDEGLQLNDSIIFDLQFLPLPIVHRDFGQLTLAEVARIRGVDLSEWGIV